MLKTRSTEIPIGIDSSRTILHLDGVFHVHRGLAIMLRHSQRQRAETIQLHDSLSRILE
jgi:hypothetical protein